jgi:competence protein ComGF
MTFAELFDELAKIKILDFLADHPNNKYRWVDIKERVVSIRQNRAVLTKLINAGLVKQQTINQKIYYQINAKNDIVKAVLKYDFEKGSEAADMDVNK